VVGFPTGGADPAVTADEERLARVEAALRRRLDALERLLADLERQSHALAALARASA
jgi:hypothetical protein